ncbi:hypothetical protein MASR2M78_00530 [Treponema sp.]
MKRSGCALCLYLIASFILSGSLAAQGLISSNHSAAVHLASSHQGPINAIAYDQNNKLALSVGDDGFVVAWDLDTEKASARFQLSPYGIRSIALRPNKTEFAVVETDGLGLYRVSAWNYKNKEKLFTLRFKDPVPYITYSASGSYLIVTRTTQNGLVLLDPADGSVKISLSANVGQVAFAATGKSERSMITYSPSGSLSYWDLSNGAEIKRVSTQSNLQKPLLFGNNRFFAGISASDSSMLIIDAQSGSILRRMTTGPLSFLAVGDEENAELLLLEYADGELKLQALQAADPYRYPKWLPFRSNSNIELSAVSSLTNGILLGYSDGSLAFLSPNNKIKKLSTRERLRIRDAAASYDSLIALSSNSYISLPDDPLDIRDGSTLHIHYIQGEDRLIALNDDRYLFWHSDASAAPVLRGKSQEDLILQVPLGIPFRSAAVLGKQALFLDAKGLMTLVSLDTGKISFSFSSVGILDVCFKDDRYIIAAKSSAVSPAYPLLSIDIQSGETVPLELKSEVAVRLYRGESGVYAVLVDTDAEGPITSIVKLDFSDPANSKKLLEYRAEDILSSVAEVAGSMATTLGGDGASLSGDQVLQASKEVLPYLVGSYTHLRILLS